MSFVTTLPDPETLDFFVPAQGYNRLKVPAYINAFYRQEKYNVYCELNFQLQDIAFFLPACYSEMNTNKVPASVGSMVRKMQCLVGNSLQSLSENRLNLIESFAKCAKLSNLK